MMKQLYSLLMLILTPIKIVHAFQEFMLVSMTFVAISHEELLMKDFALKYFLEVKAVAIRTNSPKSLIIRCRVYFLSLSSFTHESIETEEHFRDLHN